MNKITSDASIIYLYVPEISFSDYTSTQELQCVYIYNDYKCIPFPLIQLVIEKQISSGRTSAQWEVRHWSHSMRTSVPFSQKYLVVSKFQPRHLL